MKSIITGLFLVFILIDINAQIPELPNKKETKEFMSWFTSEYYNSMGFNKCLDVSIINPDSLMMWDDSNGFGIQKWPRAAYYGAFKDIDLDYAREQTMVLLNRRKYLDSIHFSQLDSSTFLKIPTSDKRAGYSAELLMSTFGSRFAMLCDKWSPELLPDGFEIVPVDTNVIIRKLTEIEEDKCGQWVSYPIFSKDHKSVFLIYYNLVYENRHDDIALFENRAGQWSLKKQFNYWEGSESTNFPDRNIIKK
jgi:hypothetical protein